MKRQIKFRGKTKSGEWVYGDLVHNALNAHSRIIKVGIKQSGFYPVEILPETVCQFTGIIDKNGKEIYEGDIISERWMCEVYRDDDGTFMVKFHLNPMVNKPMKLSRYLLRRNKAGTAERDNIIIGNIHQNLELLK